MKKKTVISRVLAIPGGILAVILTAAFIVLANADLYIRLYQATGMVRGTANKWTEKSNTCAVAEGVTLHSGIRYGEAYPNSFLDVYTSDESNGLHPVYLFIHGGGYAWGDKYEGDPLGSENGDISGITEIFVEIARSGYAVVSINYALTPDYRYPVPLLQIDQAVEYLKENADDLGLDMSKVVLSGGSAGGQLAGQYAALVTNGEYAGEMNISPAISDTALMGVVFRCALLEPENFDDVNTLKFKIMFRELKEGYFLSNRSALEEADVTRHVTAAFPPTYITDGNHGTFDAQARRLHQRLDELQVYNVFNYYPPAEARLEHGYDCDLSIEYARDNLALELEFLNGLINR